MAPIIMSSDVIQRIIYFLIHDVIYSKSQYSPYWTRLPEAVQYASVSRFWQDEIERETFAHLRLNWIRLPQLNSIVTPRRRRFVRTIRLKINLPRPGPRLEPESDEEKLRNNRAVQATFEAFLQSLGQWNVAEVHSSGIKLSIYASLPSGDPRWRAGKRIEWEDRFSDSVLELTNPQRIAQLPTAMAITSLDIDKQSGRHISAVALCVLLAKLPAAKHVNIDWWKSLLFVRMRNDLADALSLIHHSMDKLFLCDSDFTNINQAEEPAYAPETLIEGEDEFSNSTRVISQLVKEFKMQGIVVTDEIFFPRELSTDITEPQWDRLVYFYLDYPPVDPSGELLFLPDPYRTESESEASINSMIRSAMTDERLPTLDVATPAIQQFYLSAARAASQMPKLKGMELIAELGNFKYWHQFRYYVQGPAAKATWTSSSGFIPEDEVLEYWHKVPRKHLQTELDVEITNTQHAW